MTRHISTKSRAPPRFGAPKYRRAPPPLCRVVMGSPYTCFQLYSPPLGETASLNRRRSGSSKRFGSCPVGTLSLKCSKKGSVYGEVGGALRSVIQASKLLAALITSTTGLKVAAGANSQWQKGGLHLGSVGLGSDTDHFLSKFHWPELRNTAYLSSQGLGSMVCAQDEEEMVLVFSCQSLAQEIHRMGDLQ